MAKQQTGEKAKLVLALSEPIEWNGEVVTELEYRAATGRDIRKALNIAKSGDRYMAMAVDLFERPEKLFAEMSGPDFMAVTDVIDGFFARPQTA